MDFDFENFRVDTFSGDDVGPYDDMDPDIVIFVPDTYDDMDVDI